MLAIGIAGSSAYSSSATARLQPEQTISVAGYSLRYDGTTFHPGANHDELRAHLAVFRGGRPDGVVSAGKNNYHVESFFSNAVAIRTDWLRAQDLFVIAQQFNRDGSVDVKVIVNPLVDMIWFAGAVFLVGSLVAMWPDGREKRRHARRTFAVGIASA